jgi:ABC-2 type transport system permease protein
MKNLSALSRQLSVSGEQGSAAQTQLPEPSQKSVLLNIWQLVASSWLLLLVPRFFALRNGLRRRGRSGKIRTWVLATLMVLFWAGAFWFFQRILGYFQTVPDLGPMLSQKLLNMMFLTFLAVLMFSNMITGLSTFFLSRDLLLLIPAPVPPSRLFLAKFIETLVDSSWMILLFTVPVFFAYGIVHGGGFTYYLITLLTIVPFLMIPAALGIIVTMALAYLLPAQRGKDMLVVFSALFLALLYMFLRMLQPEKLVNPEAFSDFMTFLAAMQTPSSPLLPSTWATETLLPFLGLRASDALFSYLMLLSTALFLVVAGAWLSTTLYPLGWSKAQEGRRRYRQRQWSETFVNILARPFPPYLRFVVIKDLKTFMRDAGQWSQLFQLVALVVIYIYNFSVLPVISVTSNAYAFFNLALGGFVITSIAVRFVFPALSLEGKTFWVMKSAPLHLRQWWWSKFWVNLLPLLFFGELLVILTNYFLQVSFFMAVLAPVTLLFLAFTIVAMGMAVGVAYPNFTAEHSAKIAASYGGLLYMVLSISFIGIIVMLEAWPVHVMTMSSFRRFSLASRDQLLIGMSFAIAFTLTVAIFWICARWSMKQLEEMEISL